MGRKGSWTCEWVFQLKVECIFFLFSDVVIPESPEAYIKLTENTLKSSSGRKRKAVVWQHESGACHKLKLKPTF